MNIIKHLDQIIRETNYALDERDIWNRETAPKFNAKNRMSYRDAVRTAGRQHYYVAAWNLNDECNITIPDIFYLAMDYYFVSRVTDLWKATFGRTILRRCST